MFDPCIAHQDKPLESLIQEAFSFLATPPIHPIGALLYDAIEVELPLPREQLCHSNRLRAAQFSEAIKKSRLQESVPAYRPRPPHRSHHLTAADHYMRLSSQMVNEPRDFNAAL